MKISETSPQPTRCFSGKTTIAVSVGMNPLHNPVSETFPPLVNASIAPVLCFGTLSESVPVDFWIPISLTGCFCGLESRDQHAGMLVRRLNAF